MATVAAHDWQDSIVFATQARPKYFTPISVGLLCLLAYAKTALAQQEVGVNAQLLVCGLLASVWFAFVGLRISAAVFATVALQPVVLLGRYLMLPGMALTLTDLFSFVTLLLFFARPQPLYRSRFTSLLLALWVVCLFSILFSSTPVAFAGVLLRLSLSVGFLTVILASPGDGLKKPVFYGLLVLPLVMLASMAAVPEGFLWKFLSFYEGQLFFGQIVSGNHGIIYILFYSIPLLYYLRLSRLFLFTFLLYLLVFAVFSGRRSLIISVGIVLLIYLLFVSTPKSGWLKPMLSLLIASVLFVGVSDLDYFNFGAQGSKAASSNVRRAKIEKVFQTYLNNPVLGVGYGTSGVFDVKQFYRFLDEDVKLHKKEDGSDYDVSYVTSNAETTLFQILAETGTLGGLVSLSMLVLASKRLIQLLRDKTFSFAVKLTLLIAVTYFFGEFLASDLFSQLPFYTAVPFILGRVR